MYLQPDVNCTSMNLLVVSVVCVLVTTVLARPPQNVVEMKEGEAALDDAGIPVEVDGKVGKVENNLLMKFSGNKDKVLSVDKLMPADHLDAVKLEPDGMINKDYKKEIFLGNHEEIDDDTHEIAESKVKDIFVKVDTDKDGKLSQAELESWIIEKTQEHFDEALEENAHVFKHLDPDGDGFVEWKEYYVHFLLAKGFPMEQATKHVEDYDVVDLQFEDRESLIRYKFKWTDADIDPMDNRLTEKEFLAFRHPEQSDQALNNMLKTIVEALDKNDDGELTEGEFVTLPLGDVDDDEQAKLDKEWQAERSHEFNKQIDADHNGRVTRDELKVYLDPRNPDQAKSDARSLLDMMDDDRDGHISWLEIDKHRDVFIQSKIVNVKRILHDEM